MHIVWQALYMAMKYAPKVKQSEIEAIICGGCRYDNDEEELACCWCQVESMFEKMVSENIVDTNVNYEHDKDLENGSNNNK